MIPSRRRCAGLRRGSCGGGSRRVALPPSLPVREFVSDALHPLRVDWMTPQESVERVVRRVKP